MASWLENKTDQGWIELRDMTPEGYGQKFAEYQLKGYRVADIECYERDNKLTYAAIWETNQAGRSWAALREMSAQARPSSRTGATRFAQKCGSRRTHRANARRSLGGCWLVVQGARRSRKRDD